MLVTVNVNSLKNGTVEIFVSKPQAKAAPVKIYPSLVEARAVLVDFGIDEKEVDGTLKLLAEAGPNQPMIFSPRSIAQYILWDHGFTI